MAKFTHKTPEKIHEILMEQLPHWYKPVLEYIAIMRGYSVTVSDAEKDAEKIHDNFYIQTADAETLTMWERMLGITSRYGDTLDYRRERIISRLSAHSPYTFWSLDAQMTEYFGDDYTIGIDYDNLKIYITTTSDVYGAVDLLRDLIHRVVPVHLYVISNQQVTNYVTSRAYYGTRISRTLEQTIGAHNG